MQKKENKSSKISGATYTDTRQSELQTIIDSVPAMIFYKDTRNRFLKVNRAFCELIGIQKEKLEGKSLFDIFPEKEANAYYKDDLEVISIGKDKTGITEAMHTKNGDVWIKTDKIPYRDPEGKIIGIIGFSVDITQSLLSEGYLKKFNRVLRAISGSNRVLTHAKSEHDYLQSSCEIICKECGYKLAWIGLAKNDAKKTVCPAASAGFEEGYLEKLNITWADSERGRGPTGMAIRTGKITICRDILNDPDFKPWREEAVKRGYASSIAIPLQSGNDVLGALMLYSAETDPFSKDEIALLMEMGFDLFYGIELIRARERNLAAEKEIENVATFPELNPNPISEIDASGKIGYVNASFKKQFPNALKSPFKHPWFKDIHVYFGTMKGQKVEFYSRDVRVNDRYYMQTMLYMPVAGTIRTYGVDITKRKNIESEIQRLYLKMEVKVKERTVELIASKHLADLGTLAATVAHELRNPLSVINVAAYNLRKKIKDRDIIKHVANVEKKVAESSQIINNLLVYSKIKMPQFEKIEIYVLLDECIAATKSNNRGGKIKIVGILKPIKKIVIDADPLQIREIFTNLIINACQAVEAKRGAVEVKASVKKGGYLSVCVKDSGTGIAPQDMENIFKPFYTSKTKGTGLGLSICRDMVKMHNGTIEVKSILGKGSVFTVILPIRRSGF